MKHGRSAAMGLQGVIAGAITMAGMIISSTALAQGAPSVMATPQNNNGRSEDLRANGLLRPDIDTPDGFRIYSRMLVVARCLSGIGRKAAEDALAQPLNSPAERSRLANLQMRMASCVSPGLPSTLSLIRGSLSEELYKRTVRGNTDVGKSLEPQQAQTFVALQAARFASLDANDGGLLRASDCVVMHSPKAADVVLTTKLGTAEEARAMDALFAAPDCGATSRPPRISRPFLRAFVANSAYRLLRWRAADEAS